jgi:hypothetical protein
MSASWQMPGTHIITATVTDGINTFTDTHTIAISETPGPRLNMNLTVSALINVTVVDETGVALTNEQVNFSTNYGTVLPAETFTNTQGDATVVVMAEDNPGTATVTITADGITESVVVRFGEITDAPALYLPLIQR